MDMPAKSSNLLSKSLIDTGIPTFHFKKLYFGIDFFYFEVFSDIFISFLSQYIFLEQHNCILAAFPLEIYSIGRKLRVQTFWRILAVFYTVLKSNI